jgi:pilus assembly protein CpaF
MTTIERAVSAHRAWRDRELVDRVHDRVVALDPAQWAAWSGPAQRERVEQLVRDEAPLAAPAAVTDVVDRVLASVGGLGPLEPLLDDPAVTEVMVNGGGQVWVERGGRLARTELCLDEPLVLHLIERIVAPLGLRVDRSCPVVDGRLADGSRVNAIIRPVAVDGPCLTIRRFGVRAIPLEGFASPGVVALLQWAIAARLNLLVSGGTGSGKTTLLNALAAAIPPGERIITIEDTAELKLPADHVVRLESRPGNVDGAGALRVRDLLRNALRMRPDRLIVGEVRGDEALDMLQAMNTGHEGSMSTCHANGGLDALRRIETMILMGADDVPHAAIREQIAASVDLVVHVERRLDGTRRITEVHEVGAGNLVGDGVLVAPPARAPRHGATAPLPLEWIGR